MTKEIIEKPCPICGRAILVYNSRIKLDRGVYLYNYKCPLCDHRVSSSIKPNCYAKKRDEMFTKKNKSLNKISKMEKPKPKEAPNKALPED